MKFNNGKKKHVQVCSLGKIGRIINNNWIPIIIFISIIFSIFRSTRFGKELYLIASISSILVIFISGKTYFKSDYHSKILYLFLLLVFYSALTSCWSYYPAYSFIRSIFFLFIIVSATFTGFLFSLRKVNLYSIFSLLNITFLLFAIFSLFTEIPSDAWTANHGKGFMAFMAHQNTFAALLLFTSIGPIGKLLLRVVDLGQFKVYNLSYLLRSESSFLIFYTTIVILNIIFIIASHSRTSILSISLFMYLSLFFVSGKKNKLFLSFTFILIILIIVLIPKLQKSFEEFYLKGQSHLLSTRAILWEPSFEAAQNGGVFGIGFSISDPTVDSYYSKINPLGVRVREKGNSFLAYIEEIGLVGLFIMLIILIFFGKTYLKKYKHISSNSILDSKIKVEIKILLLFVFVLLIHSQFESWWVWLGSIYLQIFFIILSYIPSIQRGENLVES